VPTPTSDESLALPPPRDVGLLAIALAGVSMSGPLMAATAAPALAIAFWRNALGAGFAVAIAGVRHVGELRTAARRTWATAGLAGLALAAHFGTWVPSVTMTSVASATALVSTQSIFTALLAQAMGRRLPRPAWVGIGVALVGTALITGADIGLSARSLAGDLLAIVGGFFAAVYVTAGARVRTRLSASSYTAICYPVCAAALLVVTVIGGVPLSGYSGNAWVKIVLVTLCAQLLGHSLLNVVLRSTSPTVVSLAILFETPGAAVVAYLWLHQRPPLSALPGFVLLIVGLALVARVSSTAVSVEVEALS
jgi:drug/metabolite transporter (DMT)-like permease